MKRIGVEAFFCRFASASCMASVFDQVERVVVEHTGTAVCMVIDVFRVFDKVDDGLVFSLVEYGCLYLLTVVLEYFLLESRVESPHREIDEFTLC